MKKLSTTLFLLFLSCSLFSQEVGYIKMKCIKKPIVQADINGKKGYFLVDTGAEISVINKSDLKKYKLESAKIYGDHKRAVGFNGSTTAVMKIKNAEVTFGEFYDHKNFYCLDLSTIVSSIEVKTGIRINGIIGTDILTKYNCVIDYNQRQIVLVSNKTKRKFAAR